MKNYLLPLIFILVLVFKVHAQENSYGMIIKMKGGTVLSIGPNEIDSIFFDNNQIIISGANISEVVDLISQNKESTDKLQANVDTIKKVLVVQDSLLNGCIITSGEKYKIDNIIIDNPSRDGFDFCGSRTIFGAGNAPLCSGDRNVIFGTQNLYFTYMSNKDNVANRNVAVGYHSQFRNMDGVHNVSVGNESLDNLSHGYFNTAVGSNALRIQGVENYGYTTEGETINYNTAVGGNSMYSLIGNGNIGIGYNTLCGEYGATGNNNMAIGTEAGAHHRDENYCFYLDNIPRENNKDEKDKSLMYGKFDETPDNQLLRINAGLLLLPYLPCTDPNLSGALWNDNGILKISCGK